MLILWVNLNLPFDLHSNSMKYVLLTRILWPPDASFWLIGKDPDAGKDWRQEEKGTTGWDSWMASLTLWTWVWVNSGRWWWTGRPGVLRFMGLQRVRHDWAAELNWLKAHLTSHSKMSGCRWVITPSWLSGSWRSFLYSSSVYSCHLLNTFCFC